MKYWIIGVSLVLGTFFIAPTPSAHAWSRGSISSKRADSQRGHDRRAARKANRWSYGESSQRSSAAAQRSSSSAVPELDPGAAGSAVVLLLGGVAYVLSRRREQEDIC